MLGAPQCATRPKSVSWAIKLSLTNARDERQPFLTCELENWTARVLRVAYADIAVLGKRGFDAVVASAALC